jgi:RNA:NAD 2'-phosphotransferase (TPT1/KptA family)
MARAGFHFYVSPNGVWLTDSVPYHFVDEPDTSRERSPP